MGCGLSKASPEAKASPEVQASREKELIVAAERGDTNKISSLLKAGTNVNCRNEDGETALTWAARNGHKDTVQLLLEYKADTEAKNKLGNTALMLAAAGGHKDAVQLLLEYKADTEAKNKDGWTALIGAAYWGRKDTVQLLLEHKADTEATNNDGDTALMWVAANGHKDTVQLLLEYKADTEAKDKDGKTALQHAIDGNESEVVEVLKAAAAAKKEREAAEAKRQAEVKRQAEAEAEAKRQREAAAAAEAKRQVEEAEVAAIGGLGALMQSLGLDAHAAARFCQTNGAERVEDLARSDFAEQLARELGVSEVMAVKLIQAIKGDDVALTAPAGLSYASVMPAASEFANPPQSTGLLLMGDPVSMLPGFEHAGLPLASFSVEPSLPAGLTLNAQTGEIHGKPSSVTARRDYTVTMANMSGKTDFIVSLEVAGWKQLPPEMWNVQICQTWLREDLEMEEGDMADFVNVDGTQLVTLESKADVASKFPSLKAGVQKLLAQNVSRLVCEWEQKETADAPKGSAEDPALEALISNIRAAASELGLDVERSPDLLKDKFDASKLVMGLPPDAGRGINPFLNYEGGEQALLAQAARGLDAIMEEVDKHGTEEAKECAKYVREKEAGDSTERFQEGWKRDCDPVTGEVLESRMVADPSAPGGKRPMRFEDFCKHEIAQFCRLTKAEVFALRFYTTAGFKVINWPLRDEERRARQQPHKLAVLVFILAGAIKKLRAWAANSAPKNIPLSLFRGMSVREIFDTFMEEGGTELAPMSATAQLKIALFYSQGRQGTISTLLWIRTENFMDRGVDLEWLSAFPHEKEYLYPPLSFLKPIQTEPTVLKIGSCLYQVVELKISMS